jgi:hypothetical protein
MYFLQIEWFFFTENEAAHRQTLLTAVAHLRAVTKNDKVLTGSSLYYILFWTAVFFKVVPPRHPYKNSCVVSNCRRTLRCGLELPSQSLETFPQFQNMIPWYGSSSLLGRGKSVKERDLVSRVFQGHDQFLCQKLAVCTGEHIWHHITKPLSGVQNLGDETFGWQSDQVG